MIISIVAIIVICIRGRKEEEEEINQSKYVYRPRDDSIVRKSSNAPMFDDDLPDGDGSQPITEPH